MSKLEASCVSSIAPGDAQWYDAVHGPESISRQTSHPFSDLCPLHQQAKAWKVALGQGCASQMEGDEGLTESGVCHLECFFRIQVRGCDNAKRAMKLHGSCVACKQVPSSQKTEMGGHGRGWPSMVVWGIENKEREAPYHELSKGLWV